MFKPVSLFVGLRYTRNRRRNLLVSFVSIVSMLGVSLGVTTLIVVLSIINGSTSTMRDETLKSVPHALISGFPEDQWTALASEAEAHPQVVAAAPFIEGEAWLRHQGNNVFVRLRGIDPARELSVLDVASDHEKRLFSRLAESEQGIILGTQLAATLGVYGNASLSLTPLRSLLGRSLNDAKGFDVVGTADFGFYGNQNIAVINLETARELFQRRGTDNSLSSNMQVRLKVDDVFNAKIIASQSLSQSNAGLSVIDWSESQASLFNALQMEKILTGFMLLMIVIIGAVNIVSTLVMVVADKGADIAILRTMGASRTMIMSIFVIQGSVAGLIGTLVGAFLGILLVFNIIDMSIALERFINNRLQDQSIYLISHLQTELIWSDVGLVCSMALVISFFATLYPAWRASKVHPAEVLRYE